MLIELFLVGFDKVDAETIGLVFDDYKGASDYILDQFGPGSDMKIYSATVGVNSSDLTEVTE